MKIVHVYFCTYLRTATAYKPRWSGPSGRFRPQVSGKQKLIIRFNGNVNAKVGSVGEHVIVRDFLLCGAPTTRITGKNEFCGRAFGTFNFQKYLHAKLKSLLKKQNKIIPTSGQRR